MSEEKQIGSELVTGELGAGELADVEELLKSLAPHGPRLSKSRLMFLAGQESAKAEQRRHPSASFWCASTAVMTLVATVLGVLLSLERPLLEVERNMVVQPTNDPAPEYSQGDSDNDRSFSDRALETPQKADLFRSIRPRVRVTSAGYLRDRQTALAMGIDALGSAPTRRDRTAQTHITAYGQLRRQLFQSGSLESHENYEEENSNENGSSNNQGKNL